MINKLIAILFISIIISACNNQSGYEYMPNMYRSPSLETYSTNTYFKDSINARLPVEGTIARNYLSTFTLMETWRDIYSLENLQKTH